MSSILKALKKIEENSPPLESYPSMSKAIDKKQLIDSNTKNSRRKRRIIYILIILLLIGGTTGLLFNQRQMFIAKVLSLVSSESQTAGEGAKSDGANLYRAKIPPSSPKPVPEPSSVTRQPLKKIKKKAPEIADKRIPAGKRPINRNHISDPTTSQKLSGRRKAPAKVPDSKRKKTVKKASTPPGLQPVKRPSAKKESRRTAATRQAAQPAQSRTRTKFSLLEGDKLKLQALAWSDDAARRMAVINDRIVHEGDSVDGYQILEIRKEDIIVKGGGKSWRLEFGLKQ